MSDIYVDDLGEGFPFVLVHGYLGSSEMWTFQKEFFSKDKLTVSSDSVCELQESINTLSNIE